MKLTANEVLLEALSLNKNASAAFDEYPDEDMESLTTYELDGKEVTRKFDTKVEYEDVLE